MIRVDTDHNIFKFHDCCMFREDTNHCAVDTNHGADL
jgi:hypothetical protein